MKLGYTRYTLVLLDCLNVMHLLQMSCTADTVSGLAGLPWWLTEGGTVYRSLYFAVNISFAWSNSLTLTNISIFQAHIAICGTGRGEEACFLVRQDLLNKTSDQCSVWWRPQSPPVAQWTDSRVRVWPSQLTTLQLPIYTTKYHLPS